MKPAMLFGWLAWPMACGLAGAADERIYLDKPDIERMLVGKGLESRNRSTGLMCVTMLARTGCRYWFHQGGAFANAISKEADAPLVAEVRFE